MILSLTLKIESMSCQNQFLIQDFLEGHLAKKQVMLLARG